MKTILVTGVLGFIFSNFIKFAINKYPQYRFVGIDKAVKSYNLNSRFDHKNYKFYLGDIADQHLMDNIFRIEKPDIIINGAAESFVDDSIKDITPFLHSNILGTQCLINSSLQFGVEKFIQISTDEVYGQLQLTDNTWTETFSPRPRNPYSASKYSAEIIVHAASETHGLKYNITRSSNNYGAMQPPRNLIPKIITLLLHDEEIPIHGNGKQIREWLYVKDNCSAIMKILEKGADNEIYNIGSNIEIKNIDVVYKIGNIMNIEPKIKFITDRKGHDQRYGINCSKIKELGWFPQYNFDQGIKESIEWYQDNLSYYG
jgi:dTDP-glucose 4,6-dehydratase